MGWIIAGCVVGAILLIIFIILMLPVYMCLQNDENGKVKLYFKILWLKFGEKKNPNSVITKTAEKIVGISKFKNLETIKETIKEDSFSKASTQFAEVLVSLLKQVFWLLPRCTLNLLFIKAVSASDDAAEAAIEYGTASAIIYSLVGYLKANMKCKEDSVKIDLSCKYNSNDSELFYNLILSVRIFKVVRALFVIIKENVEKEIYQ